MIMGGKRPPHLEHGYLVEPTIFDGVTPSTRIFKEEVFGPAFGYGLTASIFTENISAVMRFTDDVETGMVHVTEPTVQLPLAAPGPRVGERELAEERLNSRPTITLPANFPVPVGTLRNYTERRCERFAVRSSPWVGQSSDQIAIWLGWRRRCWRG